MIYSTDCYLLLIGTLVIFLPMLSSNKNICDFLYQLLSTADEGIDDLIYLLLSTADEGIDDLLY